uniref:thymidine phosphorylase n=1 Tax=Pararhizobium sp. IMCC3301 TaxID=3067904 RepID=UPI00274138D1|nr:thymidine phosphorylase [Pararhizobium sp. IMCC3301]
MSYLPQELIRKKRDGFALEADEIKFLINGLVGQSVKAEQISAFAMAVYFNDMTMAERVALTEAMRDSGDVLDWSDLPGPALDKHSSGGVGDNVSLMLAPLVAACGGYVPMISGRGLGHTGGTLDKFDAIPGYQTSPDNALFRKTVRDIGCAIIGQTANLAPADKLIYGIRDVTATVESEAMITASILSKKLAAGLSALVLDVKCGNGAFMATEAQALGLANSLGTVANGAGLPTLALVTDMNQPLANAAGNAVEVQNAVDFLTRARPMPRMERIVLALCAEMLVLGGLYSDTADAHTALQKVWENGQAAEVFERMVAALGGPADFISAAGRHLPVAPIIRDVFADEAGPVSRIKTRDIGLAVIGLGGGRTTPDDQLDYSVGFSALAGIGDMVDHQTPLGRVHASSQARAEAAAAALQACYEIGGEVEHNPVILHRLGPEDFAGGQEGL